jgi:hypothetical protein
MKKHPFKWFVDADGDRIQIDQEIAPLIRQIWDMGLDTLNSCQDNFGYVWVEFTTATGASTFLSTIAKHGDADLRYRAIHPCDVSPCEAAHHLVNVYRTFQDSWLIAADTCQIIDGGDDVCIRIGIRFPRDHLAPVMDALMISRPKAHAVRDIA